MQPRTNLIMSHGGRHGKGGTYLRGTKMGRDVSEHVPNRLLNGNSREGWAGQPAIPGRAQEHRQRKALERSARVASNEGVAQEAAEHPDAQVFEPAESEDRAPPAPPAPPPALMSGEESEAVESEQEEELPPAPTSRRQITVMKKDELILMADSRGVDSSGTGNDIRARLRTYFFDDDEDDSGDDEG